MTRNTTWRHGLLAAALAGGLAVSGCQSHDPPSPGASPSVASSSPSPPPRPSPSPSGGEIPAAARVHSEEGAEAFAYYFIKRFNSSWTRPDPELVSSISDPECQFCRKAAETAKYLADHGQRYRSDPAELLSATAFGGAPEGEQFIAIELEQKRVDILDASGKAIHTDPHKRESFYLTLRWRVRAWSALELERTK